ncbi:hypothetical protein BASA81_014664 [Batrachochytrium salamandrivorans]|nr:hypothetical protein BASA81_014664 [Batrachochytrium salamandrivorans]
METVLSRIPQKDLLAHQEAAAAAAALTTDTTIIGTTDTTITETTTSASDSSAPKTLSVDTTINPNATDMALDSLAAIPDQTAHPVTSDVPKAITTIEHDPTALSASPDSESWLWPIQAGRVVDWDMLRVLWRNILVNHCGVERATNNNPVLLTVPISWSRDDQNNATQILFEYVNTPGIYLLDQPVAALYGAGVTSGLVVDIGHTTTDISPVFENTVIHSATVSIALGGQDIEAYIIKLMKADPAFASSFGHLINIDFARAFIQSAAFLAPMTSTAVLPDIVFAYQGQSIKVGAWRGKVMDVLFNPELINKEVPGLHEAMHLVVSNSCEPEKRLFLWENILLTGGCSLIKGIKERIEAELARLLAASETSSEFQAKDVKWTKLPDYFVEFKDRPCDASFLGGSIAAKLVFTNGGLYVTRSDYDEYGPAVSFLKSG